MPDPIAPAVKRKVKLSYLDGGLSIEAAARKHGVSPRQAFKWSSAEKWVEAKAKRNGETPPQPIKLTSFTSGRNGQQPEQADTAPLELPQSLEDMVGILDRAIARLSNAVHAPHDGRNRANAAQALAKLIEQRARLASAEWLIEGLLKFYPSPAEMVKGLKSWYGDAAKAQAQGRMLTAAHMAEMAIAAGIRPDEFMGYLKRAWEGEEG